MLPQVLTPKYCSCSFMSSCSTKAPAPLTGLGYDQMAGRWPTRKGDGGMRMQVEVSCTIVTVAGSPHVDALRRKRRRNTTRLGYALLLVCSWHTESLHFERQAVMVSHDEPHIADKVADQKNVCNTCSTKVQ